MSSWNIVIYNVYMKDINRTPQPRCSYCGKFFKPDTRTKKWQKSCSSIRCQSQRKKAAQNKWVTENPDYFTGRYSNTKQWRQRHTDYQRRWRSTQREKQRFSPINSSIKSPDTVRLFNGFGSKSENISSQLSIAIENS